MGEPAKVDLAKSNGVTKGLALSEKYGHLVDPNLDVDDWFAEVLRLAKEDNTDA